MTVAPEKLAAFWAKVGHDYEALIAPSPAVVPSTHDEGTRWIPAPDAAVWAGWVWPMPILPGGREPGISSGFAQYGKGPNSRDRPNHWGVDIMYRRWEGDGGPSVRKMGNGYYRGGKESPTHSPWWYCPHAVDCYAVGPGTIYRTRHGANKNILIDHHNVPGFGPLTTWYQHLHEIYVDEGDEVQSGQLIGSVGNGTSDLNHLHFEFRNHGLGGTRALAVVNPEPYLRLFASA